MKKTLLVPLLILFNLSFGQYIDVVKYAGAIGQEDWTKLWTNYKPNSVNYYTPTTELSGIIVKNMTLTKRNTYLLKGTVYVVNHSVLTIEPGTVIRGDATTCGTLVITKGSKIIAEGEETDPIIFTSNQSSEGRNAGDWGGIIILGDAPVNKIGGVGVLDWGLENQYSYYGGNSEHDDSGILKYVRIEYPGKKLSKSVELNGLTLAGVGRKTKIENVQISYSSDDSFELFGGSVFLKNIVSYKCQDDDFDFNYGYQGRIQFAISIRHPFISDFSGSRCIEAESYSGNANTMDAISKRYTQFSISNMTLVTLDVKGQDNTYEREAIFLGTDCFISVYNSIFSEFKCAFEFKDPQIKEKAYKNEIRISGNIFNNCGKAFKAEFNQTEISDYYFNSSFKNKEIKIGNQKLFVNSGDFNQLDLRTTIGEILKVDVK